MKRINQQGFTLIEIMIVIAIIALLATIALPGLLRARVTANDTTAMQNLKAMSTASEMFGTANSGSYPTNMTSLTGANPAYFDTTKDYCGKTNSGFSYVCTMTATGYTFVATPQSIGSTGTTTYTVVTGGVLTP